MQSSLYVKLFSFSSAFIVLTLKKKISSTMTNHHRVPCIITCIYIFFLKLELFPLFIYKSLCILFACKVCLTAIHPNTSCHKKNVLSSVDTELSNKKLSVDRLWLQTLLIVFPDPDIHVQLGIFIWQWISHYLWNVIYPYPLFESYSVICFL